MSLLAAGAAAILSMALQPALGATQSVEAANGSNLTAVIGALDERVFRAYNDCDMATFEDFFSPRVEFYHDTGGATFDRATVVANTKKYICGKVHRNLIVSSLHVYPVKDFGAIEEGEHKFCQFRTGNCDGVAKFLIIWRRMDERWQITRVLSFGHRALTEGEKVAVKP